MTEEKISIIVPTHNSESTICRCLNAVFLDSKAANYEVIIVDDFSSDDTLDKVGNFPVKIITLKRHSGAAVARNAGASAAEGEILFFLDSDVEVESGWREEIVESFSAYPQARAVQGVYDVNCPIDSFPSLSRNFYKCYNIKKIKNASEIPGMNSYCFAIKKDAFENAGKFDPGTERVEDLDLATRLVSSGGKIILNKRIIGRHLKKYNLFSLLKTDYLKVLAKMRLILNKKKSEKTKITFSLNDKGMMLGEFITLVLAGLLFLTLIFSLVFLKFHYAFASLILLLTLFLINAGFFNFMRKNSSFSTAAICLLIYFCEMLAAFSAIVAGSLQFAFGKIHNFFGAAVEKFRWIRKIFFRKKVDMPEQITFFVTERCNLKCRHCFLNREVGKNKNEFSVGELKRVLRSVGKFSFVSLGGGEPFLRSDLPEIAEILVNACSVRRISIPTNGYFTYRIVSLTREITKRCGEKAQIIVKVSIDGISEKHDEIRAANGSFSNAVRTFKKLSELKRKCENLKVGVLFTLSSLNESSISYTVSKILDDLSPDIAGLNFARGNLPLGVNPPDISVYIAVYNRILDWLDENKRKSKNFYYEFYRAYKTQIFNYISKISAGASYPLPCFAGNLSLVIDSSLNVFPCEVLRRKMGNLRDCNYDLKKLLFSAAANETREYIRDRKCSCTHECNLQINSFFNFPSVVRLFFETVFNTFSRGKRLESAALPNSRRAI